MIVEYSEQAYEICKRPYTKYAFFGGEVTNDETAYVAVCKEWAGCMTQGHTAKEALDSLQDAMLLWAQCLLDDGLPIPEPSVEYVYHEATNTASYFYSIDLGG